MFDPISRFRLSLVLAGVAFVIAVDGEPQGLTVAENWWPGPVRWVERESREVREVGSLGPFYRKIERQEHTMTAWRPFTVGYEIHDDPLVKESFHVLHPLYSRYQDGEEETSWNIFRVVRGVDSLAEPERGWEKSFEIFPIYFDYRSSYPENSYWALFPIYGELKHRLFIDRISWVVFPIYVEYDYGGETTYGTPWPFIRHREGNGAGGWAFWPLWGHFDSPGRYDRRYGLWPFLYDVKKWDEEGEMSRRVGVLPFYAREESPNRISEHYPWPFIGYTRQENPRYAEDRFLWPFFVQGEGEEMFRNRWAPFYSHSYLRGREHWWYLWPFVNHKQWQLEGLQYDLNRFLYVLIWHMEVRDPQAPERPHLEKTHLWPFFSYATNNADRTQFQFPSLLEVWTQPYEKPRDLYNSFFSLYQYERRGEGKRHSVLWDLVTVDHAGKDAQVTVGPLFDWKKGEGEHRTRLLKGLLGYEKTSEGRSVSLLWFRIGGGGK